MALNEFTAGTGIQSTPVNNNFKATTIKQVYTGSDFNVTAAGTSATDTATYEFTAITSSSLGSADYVELSILADLDILNASVSYRIEAKEVGGAYSDSLATTFIYPLSTNDVNNLHQFNWVHTLSAGEKSNGVQFRLTVAIANGVDFGGTRTVNNIQTVLRTFTSV